jgi:hypothetical protein
VVVGGFGYEANGAFFYTPNTYVLRASDGGGKAPDGGKGGDGASALYAWERGPDFPWARSGLSCVTTSAGVLCAGGCATDPAYASAAVHMRQHCSACALLHGYFKISLLIPLMVCLYVWQIFDGKVWAPVAPMNDARNWFGLATSIDPASGKEVVHAAGGYCCAAVPEYCFFSPLASVETFDPSTGNWTEAPPMPVALAGNGAAALPGTSGSSGGLVVVGGNPAGFVLVATDL